MVVAMAVAAAAAAMAVAAAAAAKLLPRICREALWSPYDLLKTCVGVPDVAVYTFNPSPW